MVTEGLVTEVFDKLLTALAAEADASILSVRPSLSAPLLRVGRNCQNANLDPPSRPAVLPVSTRVPSPTSRSFLQHCEQTPSTDFLPPFLPRKSVSDCELFAAPPSPLNSLPSPTRGPPTNFHVLVRPPPPSPAGIRVLEPASFPPSARVVLQKACEHQVVDIADRRKLRAERSQEWDEEDREEAYEVSRPYPRCRHARAPRLTCLLLACRLVARTGGDGRDQPDGDGPHPARPQPPAARDAVERQGPRHRPVRGLVGRGRVRRAGRPGRKEGRT